MINAIAELGKFEKSRNSDLTSFDIWLEDSFDNGKYPHLFLIELEKDENRNKWSFNKIDYIENSSSLKGKLLYKRGSGRGFDKTQTAKIAKSIDVTFNQKILGWFSPNMRKKFLTDKQKDFLEEIYNEIKTNKEKIIQTLKNKIDILDKKGIVLSVSFCEKGKKKFIGNFKFFSKFITEESKAAYKYSPTFKKFSFSENCLCSICNQQKDEVFGYFTSLKFYNVDKPGMVTGGFRQDKSWKNYPVCIDCALDLEMGIKVMEKSFSFNFYGLRYYLIPRITNVNGKDDIIDTIIEYKKSPRIKDSDRVRITNAEDDVFDILKDEKNNVTFNLLFYEKPQKSVFRILASIEDVLPSRIKTLFKVKDFIDNIVFFKDEKEGKRLFRFNFGALRTFFPNSKIEGNLDKSFLDITQKIFNDIKIDYKFIIRYIIYRIRNLFVKDNSIWFTVIQAFMLVNYLDKLNLLRNKTEEVQMNEQFFKEFTIETKEEFKEKVRLFFNNFNIFFTTDAHCSIFLTGILTQLLLNIQMRERSATPFRSRLKGLKMDGRDISSLLPDIIEKLEQYNKNYYLSLENLISEYFVSAGNFRSWNIAVDEMNFIFVLGMNLSRYFKIKSDENQEDGK